MKKLLIPFCLTFTTLFGGVGESFAETYQIDGDFDGCDYGKLYPISGGGILECREYNYFYEYAPEVRSDGRDVITIGDEKVDAYLHNGSVIETRVSDDFEGCDFDKRIEFVNGLTFVCSTYSYTYSFMPRVKIMMISGRSPEVYIGGKKYRGTLYK
tara:strand:+ start:357 stop:824 length:468 start_codon:yes stop_codon:yes gene_type:complete